VAAIVVVPITGQHHGSSIADTIGQFLSNAGEFFSQLANLSWGSLLIGMALYGVYLLLRSRALLNAVKAAYPGKEVRWRDVWGAYMVGYAINNVFPLGGGNIAQLFLTRVSISESSYPTVAAALSTGVVFDWLMGVAIMCFAFTQGVFPKPPDFSKLPAFDISFFAGHMRFTLFLLTALSICFLVAFALLSARVRAFWERLRQGFTILRDGRRWRREMASWQFASWIARFFSYWALLNAFHIGGSVRNALLVLGVQVVASVFPFTPGGLGVQQALLLAIFARNPNVASFSVGQQIATAILSSALGFAALVLIFRFKSFGEVMQRGKEHRRTESTAAPPGGVEMAPGAELPADRVIAGGKT
jgi:glycosyltransferase 2 family protein